MKKYLLIGIMGVVLASCGDGEKQESKITSEKKVEEVCTYTYNDESSEIRWTAYKHTAKNPVGGQFEGYTTTIGTPSATSVVDILSSMEMIVDVTSINTKDTARDRKIVTFFFDIMSNTGTIEGKVVSATESGGVLAMKMNGVEREVDFTYLVTEENKLELKAKIDVLNFQADEALASLNNACEEKHTGGDGKSVLWSEVSLYLTTELGKECK